MASIRCGQKDSTYGLKTVGLTRLRRLSHRLRDPFTSFAATGFVLCVLLVALWLGTDALLIWAHAHGGAR